jgi:hypothetical protein
MAVMGSPHGFVVLVKNKLTMFGAHCPFIPLDQLAESKVPAAEKSKKAAIENQDNVIFPLISR